VKLNVVSPMMILALEFSSPHRSVALLNRANCFARADVLGSLTDAGDRSAKPLVLIQNLLTRAGVQHERVEAMVIGLGPGSYTGIRSAVAVAQGWQLARGVRTYGVGSADCLAFQAQARGWLGRVSIAIDAQRSECYLATYELTAERRLLLEPLRLVDLPTLRSHAARPNSLLLGPEVSKWCTTGRVLFPEAEALAQLCQLSTECVPAEKLEPIYLREPTFLKAPPPRVLPS
jgi:tRNA threonylcarbamoyladenosine biosynthesis protein TsaB